MEILFDVKHSTISEHINNIFQERELEEKTSVCISDKSSGGRKVEALRYEYAGRQILQEVEWKKD